MDSRSSSVIVLLYRSTPAEQHNLFMYRHIWSVLTMWTSLSSPPFHLSPTLFTNSAKTDKILVQMVLVIHKHQRSCKITESQMAHECCGTCISSVFLGFKITAQKNVYAQGQHSFRNPSFFTSSPILKKTPELKVLGQFHWGKKGIKYTVKTL